MREESHQEIRDSLVPFLMLGEDDEEGLKLFFFFLLFPTFLFCCWEQNCILYNVYSLLCVRPKLQNSLYDDILPVQASLAGCLTSPKGTARKNISLWKI